MKKVYLLACTLLFPYLSEAKSTPVHFIENKGQWSQPFKYKAETGRGDVFLLPKELVYVVGDYANVDKIEAVHHGQVRQAQTLKFHEYRMVFEGANNAEITGTKKQTTYYNYFLGSDSSKWKTGIHPYLSLDYKDLYNGIDMHVSSEEGSIKYEFIVAAGANASQVKLRYEGADGLSVTKGGNLSIKTSVGEVTELKPYAYQYIGGEKKEVACNYVVNDKHVTYRFPNNYNTTLPLVIDPTVVFATFTGSTADNFGYTATYDAQGNFYAGGLVSLSAGGGAYPVTAGAFQVTYGGGTTTSGIQYACDMGIMKFSPDGVNRIWATYIGGNDNEQPHSMVTDAAGNLIIAGRTYSANFPVTAGAYDQTHNGVGDLVVLKLNNTATALIGSTYVGGSDDDAVNFSGQEFTTGLLKYNYADDARSEVLLDAQNNIYVATCTKSADFPTANAFQATLKGSQDAVVIKLTPDLSALTWSTYLGGSNEDAGYVLAMNKAQTMIYVAGGTNSADFPGTTGTWKTSYQGGSADGFIARFQNGGTYGMQKMSFLGTSNYDQCYGVQTDANDFVYVMGQSLGGTFPVTAGVYSNPHSSQFMMKMDADLSTDVFSTVYGNGDPTHTNISPVAFLVDTCENIYISGWGGSLGAGMQPTTGPNTGMAITPDAAQSTTDGNDFYFIVFAKNASSLLYGTYMGTNGGTGEHVDGGTSRFDRNGVVYQAICGGCGHGTFPTQPANVWSLTNNSQNCNEVALKIAFSFGPVVCQASAGPVTKGCAPLTINFQNTSVNAANYVWSFGDGSPNSTAAVPPAHTYTIPGVYTLRLIASNQNACSKTVDTMDFLITVDTGLINADFTYSKIDTCGPFTAEFVNTSHFSATPQNTVFDWYFSDNTTFTGQTPPVHTFPGTGAYTVTLVMTDTSACNSPDSVVKSLDFGASFVHAAGDIPDSVCLGTGVDLTNGSQNATNYYWYFGNGDTSSAATPHYTYDSAGWYTVTLITTNPNTCNGADTAIMRIKIKEHAIADFSHTPVIPVANTPVTFINHSQKADSYFWAFGDGNSSEEKDPVHMYNKTGRYTVCLEANNQDNCPDTICKKVDAEVRTNIDLPNAFSPNGDGINDILYVRGAAIKTMDLKIWNRWGELVFESTSLSNGWDGTYHGKLQEMDAYAFVLIATFIDDTDFQKQGNITLLR